MKDTIKHVLKAFIKDHYSIKSIEYTYTGQVTVKRTMKYTDIILIEVLFITFVGASSPHRFYRTSKSGIHP